MATPLALRRVKVDEPTDEIDLAGVQLEDGFRTATPPVAALVAADVTARGDVMAEGDDSPGNL